jgi:hypothetical protein
MGDCSNGIEILIGAVAGAITTKNFEFTDIQFELGSVATPYEHRPYALEKELCDWYYERHNCGGAYGYYSTGAVYNTTTVRFLGHYKPKRIPPTMTVSNVADFKAAYGAGLVDTTGMTQYYATDRTSLISATVGTDMGADHAVSLYDDGGNASWIAWGAEL